MDKSFIIFYKQLTDDRLNLISLEGLLKC